MFLFFGVLMIGVVGGMFAFLAVSLVSIAEMGFGWLYFAIFGAIGIFFGVFGSVFNTYSGLYLAKDNDLLLSMPIPSRTIVASRIFGVYLMGLLYSGVVTIPAIVVYFIRVPQTALSIAGSVLMVLLVSVIDLVLSCLLGWVVAKIAGKLKGKSFVTVIISLLFLALYYVVYFKAADIVKSLLANAAIYGESIRGKAYPIYLFGRIGEGDVAAILIYTAVTALLLVLTLAVLSGTFMKIATSSQTASKGKLRQKEIKTNGVFGALLSKEFARFKSSSTYMLNASLSTVLLPLFGVFLLIKGKDLVPVVDRILTSFPGALTVVLVCIICFIVSMNFISTPSISLEGGSIWIVKSLPIEPRRPLLAKLALHILLTSPVTVICSVMAAIAFRLNIVQTILVIAVPLAFSLMMAALGLVIGLANPNLNWTREIVPIKQSLGVMISMFSGTILAFVAGLVYFLAGHHIGTTVYLSVLLVIFAVVFASAIRWIVTHGAVKFSRL